jgi:4-amino-4-deoxy-L-arabinose transferase-like glycosyltransferase
VALLVLALAARVAYVLDTGSFIVSHDPASYDLLARGLAQGHGWVLGSSAYRPPAYPFFLAGVYLLVGIPHGNFTDVRLVQALVLSTVTVGLLGLMAKQVAGRTPALIVMAIAAVYDPLVVVGTALLTESLFVTLVLGATNSALHAHRAAKPRRWIVLAGLLAGLAALTRGNGIVVGLALAFVVWGPGHGTRRRRAWRPVALLVVMVLTIAPWTIRNAIAQHAFIPVTTELGNTLIGTYNNVAARHHFIWTVKGYSNYHAIKTDRRISESTRDDREISAVLRYIGRHPADVPQAIFWNTMRLFDLQGSFVWRRTGHTDAYEPYFYSDLGAYTLWLVTLLAIAGAFTVARRRVPRSLWLVPLAIWASEAPVTTGTPRFESPLDPFLILLASLAIAAAVAAMQARRGAQAALVGST